MLFKSMLVRRASYLLRLVINKFFPNIHKRRNEAKVVERQQFPSETFCDFVESVLGGAGALKS